jgi:2'-hydroxyisoflavone reductase
VGANAHLVWVPAEFLEAEQVLPWQDLPVWVPGHGESAGFARRDIGRALGAGLTFRPLATTAAETLAWFREQPAARQAKLRAGLDAAREAEVLERWRAGAKERR